MTTNKTVVGITLVVWFLVAAIYLIHTPYNVRSHDFDGHIKITETIVKEHRYPHPYEFWGAYHLPLFYLINSLIVPEELKKNNLMVHANYIRLLTIIYGSLALFIIYWFLQMVSQNRFNILLVLLFIATTPKFVFVFSSYNNDSLATLLSLVITAISYKLNLRWSWMFAFLLFISAVLGVHTKHSVFFTIAILIIICCKNFMQCRLPDKKQTKIIFILLLSLISLIPWLVFHNYKNTGILFPSNLEFYVGKNTPMNISVFDLLVKNPLFVHDEHKWETPYVYETKTHDYWAFSFITSIIGEYFYSQSIFLYIWILFFIHLIVKIVGSFYIFKTNLTKLSSCYILLGHVIDIAFIQGLITYTKAHHGSSMDYRSICFIWLGWAILYLSVLCGEKKIITDIFKKLLIIGIILQIYLIMVI